MPKAAPKQPPAVVGGPHMPKDGETYVPPDEDDEEEEIQEDEEPAPPPDPLAALTARLDEQSKTIDGLRQELAVRGQPPKDETPPDTFYNDIEKRLFEDPTGALKGLEDRIISKVTGEVTSSYRKDQGEQSFWREFYEANTDLVKAEDDDLIKSILQNNMSTLGGMPVAKAVEKLADLTRERIARYARGPRERPHAEGSRPPSRGKAPPPPEKVITLSDIIRNRRAKRAGGVAKGA